MKRVYLSEIKHTDKLDNETEIVLDDRTFKYDQKKGKIVRPGQPGYDELPDIIR